MIYQNVIVTWGKNMLVLVHFACANQSIPKCVCGLINHILVACMQLELFMRRSDVVKSSSIYMLNTTISVFKLKYLDLCQKYCKVVILMKAMRCEPFHYSETIKSYRHLKEQLRDVVTHLFLMMLFLFIICLKLHH